MNCMHRLRSLILTVLLCLIAVVCTFEACAETESRGVDVIVLVNNSYSMANQAGASDSNGYRYDAIAAVINMCVADNSRANFILFNTGLYTMSAGKISELASDSSMGLYDVSMSLGRGSRMQMINLLVSNKMRYTNTSGGADIGHALDVAVETLCRTDNGNDKVIILLTDSGVYIPSGGTDGLAAHSTHKRVLFQGCGSQKESGRKRYNYTHGTA